MSVRASPNDPGKGIVPLGRRTLQLILGVLWQFGVAVQVPGMQDGGFWVLWWLLRPRRKVTRSEQGTRRSLRLCTSAGSWSSSV